MEVALTGGNYGILHAQLSREFLDCLPAGVGMLDVGLGVQLEELELVVLPPEKAAPAAALEAEPAVLPDLAAAVARHVDALGAGVGDAALEPVFVRHQALPRRPPQLRRRKGF